MMIGQLSENHSALHQGDLALVSDEEGADFSYHPWCIDPLRHLPRFQALLEKYAGDVEH